MPSVPVQTHLEKWLLKEGYVKTSTTPREYTKGTITFRVSRFQIVQARGAGGNIDPLILSALTTARQHYIPISLW
jgi:hypothetical protein